MALLAGKAQRRVAIDISLIDGRATIQKQPRDIEVTFLALSRKVPPRPPQKVALNQTRLSHTTLITARTASTNDASGLSILSGVAEKRRAHEETTVLAKKQKLRDELHELDAKKRELEQQLRELEEAGRAD